eukprot:CAMPEP_0202877944 /NCGR_PEP_ID=MMETSP1391-20130828/31374_1 /ASSEMBLY_ACC=CAM_ASM_000867 /TAXON_ID=1034604 /ORGANISM="Chlamydomonas leiostraca, Strain SAG 11-49" /LENGTH=704 /DNA_ID=CAMNT_0049560053 /DNA_START=241 /DNA_END=2356 /DNA_ORIENTATION=-
MLLALPQELLVALPAHLSQWGCVQLRAACRELRQFVDGYIGTSTAQRLASIKVPDQARADQQQSDAPLAGPAADVQRLLAAAPGITGLRLVQGPFPKEERARLNLRTVRCTSREVLARNSEAYAHLARRLTETAGQQLTHLHLQCPEVSISPELLHAIAASCTQLQALVMDCGSRSPNPEDSWINAIQALPPTLSNLSWGVHDDLGACALIGSATQLTGLQSLYIHKVGSEYAEDGSTDLNMLAPIATALTSLRWAPYWTHSGPLQLPKDLLRACGGTLKHFTAPWAWLPRLPSLTPKLQSLVLSQSHRNDEARPFILSQLKRLTELTVGSSIDTVITALGGAANHQPPTHSGNIGYPPQLQQLGLNEDADVEGLARLLAPGLLPSGCRVVLCGSIECREQEQHAQHVPCVAAALEDGRLLCQITGPVSWGTNILPTAAEGSTCTALCAGPTIPGLVKLAVHASKDLMETGGADHASRVRAGNIVQLMQAAHSLMLSTDCAAEALAVAADELVPSPPPPANTHLPKQSVGAVAREKPTHPGSFAWLVHAMAHMHTLVLQGPWAGSVMLWFEHKPDGVQAGSLVEKDGGLTRLLAAGYLPALTTLVLLNADGCSEGLSSADLASLLTARTSSQEGSSSGHDAAATSSAAASTSTGHGNEPPTASKEKTQLALHLHCSSNEVWLKEVVQGVRSAVPDPEAVHVLRL